MSQATSYSPKNVALVLQATEASGCYCNPLEEQVKTYQGWKEAGRHVRKGEKALVKVLTFISSTYERDGKEIWVKRPWSAAVFCLCQTEED